MLSSTVTQGPGGQGQHYLQIIPQPPGATWNPQQIVEGFLIASAAFDNQQIAREYLAPGAKWNPTWSAIVYSKGPTASRPVYAAKGRKDTAVVTVSGTVQANLSQYGGYAVPSASKPQQAPAPFKLAKVGGQWRISQAPPELLLTGDLFNYDYQLRNLYFFDPTTGAYLVPDPVYVPLQATPVDLMTVLVKDLIHPPGDWISPGATTTALAGTSLTSVTLDGGTATVNLSTPTSKGSSTKASAALGLGQDQHVSAQLLWTLTGSGQGGSAVQSVELSVNGTPWIPPGSQQNPVQHLSQSRYGPPSGSSDKFYYLDDGNLLARNLTQNTTALIARLGREYSQNSQIAVSSGPQGSQYVAILSGGTLYAGPLGGRLTKEPGSGYLSVSWDPSGNLWATTGNAIVMLPAGDGAGQPLDQPVPVNVVNYPDNIPNPGPFTALRVAPDGVRVAIIVDGSTLNFGAIVSPQETTRASQAVIKIQLSPFYVTLTSTATFTALTWYGPDNVITLSQPGAALTEYPVDGGSSTSIPSQANISWITASSGSSLPLIAGLAGGAGLVANGSLTGLWASVPTLKRGTSPVYPG